MTGMKKSSSELALEALLRPLNDVVEIPNDGNRSSDLRDSADGIFQFGAPTATDELAFGFQNQEIISEFSTCGGVGETTSCYQSFTPQHPCVSATIDSQSSICAGSPTSTLRPKVMDNQGSGSSEDEDGETEAGPCEQSYNPLDNKRIRRMSSNRESARRSRKRKQEYLHELEMQVDQLNGESVALLKQLNEATQQLKGAATNNRVLKAETEALRAKVKLAEDMVARGSLSCNLNNFLQTNLSLPQMLNIQALSTMANMPPTMSVRGQAGHLGAHFHA